MSFAHLHLHSEYSLLDGVCRISDIPKAARNQGQSAVALTDHGVMFGIPAFYEACKKEGIKPIIGCEVYLAPAKRTLKPEPGQDAYSHLVLLCKNNDGYRNLMRLVSLGYTEGFYSKPRIDIDILREYSDGLICLTGCISGAIPRAIIRGDMEEAENIAFELFDIFGDDIFLEIQNHNNELEDKAVSGLVELSEMTGIPLVATNDVHYLRKKDAYTQKVLMCVQMGKTVDEMGDDGFWGDEFYLKSEKEMAELFPDMPDAITNAALIADECNVTLSFDERYLPKAKLGKGETAEDVLRTKSMTGFKALCESGKINFNLHTEEEYNERIEYELSVICSMGFADYFLIVADFVGYAKSQRIPVGPGRGSGAGSLIAYLVGITEIDALENDLLFETFLNPERVSMPDFDIDFCAERRGEVIEYVKEKYGSECVSHIIAFNTFAAKQAIRDVARTIGMSYADADSVVKMFPEDFVSISDALDKSKELRDLRFGNEKVSRLLEISSAIEGMPRNITIHAAGIVIFDKPLCDFVPLCVSGGEVLTQYDMNGVTKIGLLKFDFLGIRYLTVLAKAEKLVKETNSDFDITKIPLDDRKTFELLSSGHTAGLFQIESPGMQRVLAKLKPNSVSDIMDAIALYRPGPAKFIDKFIANRSIGKRSGYNNKKLETILDTTYGCIVYSEQVTQIFRAVAGYSFGKADVVSRAIKKKNLEVIEQERRGFIEGAVAKGETEQAASELFEDMVGFANYGFKKSHAAAYGIISYRTAYLKANYPARYLAALLSSVLGDIGKMSVYLDDASLLGIKLLPPDINESGTDFTVNESENIRYGLGALKNISTVFIDSIVEERKERKFAGFVDFVTRTAKYDCNKKQLEGLIKCGAFDCFGLTRSALLNSYEVIAETAISNEKRNISGQLDLFSSGDEIQNDSVIPEKAEFDRSVLLRFEKEVSGVYLSGHPLDGFENEIKSLKSVEISRILSAGEKADKHSVTVCGIVGDITRKMSKSGEMLFFNLADRTGEIEVIVFSSSREKVQHYILTERALCVSGEVTYDNIGKTKIILRDCFALGEKKVTDSTSLKDSVQTETPKSGAKERKMYLRFESFDCSEYKRALALISIFTGELKVVLFSKKENRYIAMEKAAAADTDFLQRELCELLGDGNVIIR